jgi:hypothetical protein
MITVQTAPVVDAGGPVIVETAEDAEARRAVERVERALITWQSTGTCRESYIALDKRPD